MGPGPSGGGTWHEAVCVRGVPARPLCNLVQFRSALHLEAPEFKSPASSPPLLVSQPPPAPFPSSAPGHLRISLVLRGRPPVSSSVDHGGEPRRQGGGGREARRARGRHQRRRRRAQAGRGTHGMTLALRDLLVSVELVHLY